jgi:hypothetical protein
MRRNSPRPRAREKSMSIPRDVKPINDSRKTGGTDNRGPDNRGTDMKGYITMPLNEFQQLLSSISPELYQKVARIH